MQLVAFIHFKCSRKKQFQMNCRKTDNSLLDIFLADFFFWPYHVACGIVVTRIVIKHVIPALEAQSLNH